MYAIDGKHSTEKTIQILQSQYEKTENLELKSYIKNYLETPTKSPLLAGLFQAFLPGSGYLYLGLWQTAMLSLVLNGMTLLTTYELFKNGLVFTGITSGFIFSIFYTSGIIGSIISANDVNNKNLRHVKQNLRNSIIPQLRFEYKIN